MEYFEYLLKEHNMKNKMDDRNLSLGRIDEANLIHVVLVPDYLVTALGNDSMLTIGAINSMQDHDIEKSPLSDIVGKKISKMDMTAMVAINNLMYNRIGDTVYHHKSNFYRYLNRNSGYDTSSALTDLLNHYSNDNTMSESTNDCFELMVAGNTMFVILHNGFSSNILDCNNGLNNLIEKVINSMFSNFSDESVFTNAWFKKFLKK
jgi:hypothetical protein